MFIRHTYTATEVDEETFFHGRETGGTVVSSALEEMLRIVERDIPVDDWNIYAAQASDGHNFDHDMPRTMALLEQEILPLCQYYAYIEVGDEPAVGESVLWEGYSQLVDRHAQFARASVFDPADIYPVFHNLFATSNAIPPNTRALPFDQASCADSRAQVRLMGENSSDLPRFRMGLRPSPPRARRDRRNRDRGTRAGRLSQSNRSDYQRTDARRLRGGRNAADVFALVVRKAIRARRTAVSKGCSRHWPTSW